MRILVCGDRNWTCRDTIESVLSEYLNDDLVVIHGACRGADLIAGDVAKSHGVRVMEFPADWKAHGLSAGPIRNGQMLTEGKPDLVIAFHENLRASKGTKNMLAQAKEAGVRCVVVDRKMS